MASLAQVSDVRTSQSDPSLSPFSYLWRDLTDSVLAVMLTRASRKAEDIIGSRLMPFTTTETVGFTQSRSNVGYPTFGTRTWVGYVGITPPRLSENWTGTLTGVTANNPTTNAAVTVDITGNTFTATTGRVMLPWLGFWADTTAEVTYTGGYTTVPEDLIELTILLAADTWLVQTDARDGQMDAQDVWNRAQGILTAWSGAVIPGIA